MMQVVQEVGIKNPKQKQRREVFSQKVDWFLLNSKVFTFRHRWNMENVIKKVNVLSDLEITSYNGNCFA